MLLDVATAQLTHLPLVPHICLFRIYVSLNGTIIGLDYGLFPNRCQVIILINTTLSTVAFKVRDFSDKNIELSQVALTRCHLKVSPVIVRHFVGVGWGWVVRCVEIRHRWHSNFLCNIPLCSMLKLYFWDIFIQYHKCCSKYQHRNRFYIA